MTNAIANRSPNGSPIRFDKRFTLTNERTDGLTNDYQDQGSSRLVPDSSTPVDNEELVITQAEVQATRRLLTERGKAEEALGAELDATGLTDLTDRFLWLRAHRDPLEVLRADLALSKRYGVRFTFDSLSLPKVVRRHKPPRKFTDRQMQIALAALGRTA